jgi:hypothetical protein
MKKIIVLVAIIVAGFSHDSIAQTAVTSITLPFWVSNSFQRDFQNAKNVSWEEIDGTYVATFSARRNQAMAYYQNDGKLIGVGKPVNADDLPEEIMKNFVKRYRHYTIQKAVEYSPSLVITGNSDKENSLGIYPDFEGIVYFLDVENAQSEKILKVPTTGIIEVLKNIKK